MQAKELAHRPCRVGAFSALVGEPGNFLLINIEVYFVEIPVVLEVFSHDAILATSCNNNEECLG